MNYTFITDTQYKSGLLVKDKIGNLYKVLSSVDLNWLKIAHTDFPVFQTTVILVEKVKKPVQYSREHKDSNKPIEERI